MQEDHNQQDQSKKEYWRQVCEGWQTSGESQTVYCQRLGIKLNTFSYWRGKFSVKNKKAKQSFVKLNPIRLSTGEQEKPIIIQLLSGVKIILPAKLGKDQLTSIFEILGVIHA